MSTAYDSDAAPISDRNVFYDALGRQNLGPLWESLKGLVPSEPRPKAVPYAWRYADVRPCLMEAGSFISAEEAERRVLVLQNPGLPGASQITDTIYAGLQLILPGETAPAHRHSQSALRFVIEGEGAFTAVDGERTTMHPGDFIVTPAWTWHDHGHDGEGPVVWMDGLDVPLVRFLNAGFREEHDECVQGVTRAEGDADARYGGGLLPIDCGARATTPIFNYPYERTRAALDRISRSSAPDPHHGFALKYVNPTNGDWAIPTIGASMRLLPAGFSTKPYKSTDGAVAVVVEGRVTATVGDMRIELGARDVLAIPGWTSHDFKASEDTVMFIFSDRPVYEKLGFWREHKG